MCRRDRTTSPELEHFLADRMGATTIEIESGHLVMVTHPDEVANVILAATQLSAVRALEFVPSGPADPAVRSALLSGGNGTGAV